MYLAWTCVWGHSGRLRISHGGSHTPKSAAWLRRYTLACVSSPQAPSPAQCSSLSLCLLVHSSSPKGPSSGHPLLTPWSSVTPCHRMCNTCNYGGFAYIYLRSFIYYRLTHSQDQTPGEQEVCLSLLVTPHPSHPGAWNTGAQQPCAGGVSE